MAPVAHDEGGWNPMSEDYNDPKFNAYTEGPGAEMDESLQPGSLSQQKTQTHSQIRLYVRNLPKGITDRGVGNLFLSSGKPVFVNLHSHGCTATVEFAKPREAELAIRDLDNQPPFYLKVSYARLRDNDRGKDQYEDTSTEQEWVFDNVAVDSRPKVERGEIIKHGEKILRDVCPKAEPLPPVLDYKNDPHYYQFIQDDFDMSVAYYQSRLDYHGYASNCVWRGRGYYYMGPKDRFVGKGKTFSSGSESWEDPFLSINECYHCQAKTIKICSHCRIPFCSAVCLAAMAHDCSKERLLTEAKGLPEKEKWEYVIPKLLKYNEEKVNLGTSVLEKCNAGTTGFIRLSYGGGSVYYGMVQTKETMNDYSTLVSLSTPKEHINDADTGDHVIVPDDCKVGRRGVVVSYSDSFYRVALIDSAEVVTVDKVYPPSDANFEIVSMGVQLTITEEISEKFLDTLPQKGVRFYFEATGPLESGKVPIVLKNSVNKKKLAKGFFTEWNPPRDLRCVKLKPESQVIMSSFVSTRVMYLRPDDPDTREKFSLLQNEIVHCALRMENLKEMPIIGEMYCARYDMDGVFYRVVVKSIKKEIINIVFIDFGNEQRVGKEDLKPLPESLKRVPCFAVKVHLKNVPKKSSKKAIGYLNDLTSENTELLLKFYETILNGVELRSKISGNDINIRLQDDLIPDWRKERDFQSKLKGAIFKKSILKFPGKENQQLYILHIDESDFSSSGLFWAVPNYPPAISYVYGEFKDKIEEYCEAFDEGYSYLPRKFEICFALYEGEWLRALCVGHEGTKCYLRFLDYGYTSTVETNAVRKMKKEFIEDIPCLALLCAINGYQRMKGKPELEKEVLTYLNKFKDSKITNVVVEKRKDGVNYVSIPHIERLLDESTTQLLNLIDKTLKIEEN